MIDPTPSILYADTKDIIRFECMLSSEKEEIFDLFRLFVNFDYFISSVNAAWSDFELRTIFRDKYQ